jgi:hypothetical protein
MFVLIFILILILILRRSDFYLDADVDTAIEGRAEIDVEEARF